MPEYVSCNLCGADDARLLFRRGDYRYWVDDLEWNGVEWQRCRLGCVNPGPAPDEIGRYYIERYWEGRDAVSGRSPRQTRYLPDSPGRLLDIGAARGDFLAAA